MAGKHRKPVYRISDESFLLDHNFSPGLIASMPPKFLADLRTNIERDTFADILYASGLSNPDYRDAE